MKEIANDTSGLGILRTEIYRKDRAGSPINPKLQLESIHQNLLYAKSSNSYNSRTKIFSNRAIKFPRGLLIIEDSKVINAIKKFYEDKQISMNAKLEAENVQLDGEENKNDQDIDQDIDNVAFDRTKIQLLGTDKWHKDEVINNPFMEGAVFASTNKNRLDIFKADFEKSYGYQPTDISSLAHDLISLSIAVARFTKGRDFSQSIITNPRGFVGIEGIFKFTESGLSERGLGVFMIKDGKLEVASESPKYFQ
jgi:hypothetical protein